MSSSERKVRYNRGKYQGKMYSRRLYRWELSEVKAGEGSGTVVFDEAIHDITGYEKKEIIALRNDAFEDDTLHAKRIKGMLLGLSRGSIPTIEQINSSELFALHAPQRDQSENYNEDDEGPQDEVDIHHPWLPYFKEMGALGDCAPAQFEPPLRWPKVYTAETLKCNFPMDVTTSKANRPP